MAEFDYIQYRFNNGEFSPTAQGRSELEQYFGGVAKALNVRTSVEGFIKRRDGMEFIDDIRLVGRPVDAPPVQNDGSSQQTIDASNVEFVSAIKLTIGSELNGLFRSGAWLFSKENAEDSFPTNSGLICSRAFFTGVSRAGQELTFNIPTRCRNHNFFQVVFYNLNDRSGTQEEHNRRARTLGNSEIEFIETLVDPELSENIDARLISHDFGNDRTFIFQIVGTSVWVRENGELTQILELPRLADINIRELGHVGEEASLLLFHGEIQPYRLTLEANGEWSVNDITFTNIPREAFSGVTNTNPSANLNFPTDVGQITITATANVFTADHVGQIIEITSNGVGRFRIVRYISARSVEIEVVDIVSVNGQEEDGSFVVNTNNWQLRTGYEEIWSESRGYPRLGAFHDGRLWVDGGRSLPNYLYASRINDFFNFDFGTALDDDAIGPLRRSLSPINAIYSGRALSIFTGDGEYIIQQIVGEPITPRNVNMTNQTSRGSLPNLVPQETDGGILFVDRHGQSIQQFLYTDSELAFASNDISVLASHLVDNPIDFALRREVSSADGAYLLVVRSDGGLTLVNINRSQKVASFTNVETDGAILAAQADGDEIYFVVRRNRALQIERFNAKALLDSCVFISSDDINNNTATISVPNSYEDNDKPIEFVAYSPSQNKHYHNVLDGVSVSRGQLSFPVSDSLPDDAEMQVGFNFDVQIDTLPAEFPLDQRKQTLTGKLLNITEVSLFVRDTYGFNVSVIDNDNNSDADQDDLTDDMQDYMIRGSNTEIAEYNKIDGFIRETGYNGWNFGGQIRIRQLLPLPMTILQLKLNISVRSR